MRAGVRPLQISARVAAALGFLAISLTGEMTPAWLAASWAVWLAGFLADRYPEFQTALRRTETTAVAGMVAMLFFDFFIFHSTLFVAITHFLLLFQMVKLAGEKTRKDCFQIYLFSFFQVLAACTLSVDAWQAAILLALIPTSVAVLFWNQMAWEGEEATGADDSSVHRSYRRMAAAMSAAALPVNLVLTIAVFLLFPRLTLNASLPGFSDRRSGYTDQVNLAQKGDLRQQATVVLWLKFPRAEDRKEWDGYLRGDILSQFDGRRWAVSKRQGSRMMIPDSNGVFMVRPAHSGSPLLRQIVTLVDTSATTLFTIGRPVRIVAPLPALQENEGGSLHWMPSWRRPLRYEAISEPYSDADVRPGNLELPFIPLERIRWLTRQIAGKGSPLRQARNIEQYLQKNYRYSATFGERIAENPVEDFLFDRRQGLCGHFASAMALMLRLRNIPSRLVAGYLKGEWNEPAQSVVIRERDAHAWVEAYIPNRGWVSFDPTPRPASSLGSGGYAFPRILQYWDFLSLEWNRFVIQYDLYSQIRIFQTIRGGSGRFGSALSSWWSRAQFTLRHSHRDRESAVEGETSRAKRFPVKSVFIFLSMASVSFFLVQRRRATELSTLRFYRRFLETMARRGYPKAPEETGLEFAARISIARPEHAALAKQTTERYYHSRFGKGVL